MLFGRKTESYRDILPSFLRQKLGFEIIHEPNIPEFNEAERSLIETGGINHATFDYNIEFQNIAQLVLQYEQFSLLDFVEEAIDEIVDEAIIIDDFKPVVEINLDAVKGVSESIKNKVIEEFNYLKRLLKFDSKADEYFKNWYKRGRYYLQCLFSKNKKEGIVGFHHLSPYRIMRFFDDKSGKYFYYISKQGDDDFIKKRYLDPKKIDKDYVVSSDHIVFVPSGLTDAKNKFYISHLHKAIKPANMLKMMEDSMVVYRFCLTGDTRIRTKTGYKHIKDLTQNDKVYCFNQEKQLIESNILHHINNGVKKVYKVRSKHHEIIGTDTHPILVNRDGNLIYVDIKDLKIKSDKLITTVRDDNQLVKIPRFFGDVWAKLSENQRELFKQKTYSVSKSKLMKQCSAKTDRVKQFLYSEGKALPLEQAIEICDVFELDSNNLIKLNKAENNSERINLPEYVDAEFAKLFGFMIGDGSIVKRSKNKCSYQLSFATGMDKTQNQYYANLLEKYFGVVKFQPEKRSKHKQLGCYVVDSKIACQIFESMGYISGAHNKRIPEWVFTASKEIRRAFIEGISNADGCEKYTDTNTWYSSIEMCNKSLIEDIKEVWSSIGLNSGHISKNINMGGHEIEPGRIMPETISYTLTISELELPEFENVLSVEYVGEEEVFDITVENELHNFIANGIPVHNTRAPERRAFYIDVGRLGSTKAEQYVKTLMNKFKTRLTYDTTTGMINQSKSIMTMLEDYWLPRMGTKGTEVQTISGGQQLGEITDVLYFKRRTWKALKIPSTRADNDNAPSVDFGSNEFSREELKFARFSKKLRSKFIEILKQPLKTHLILKNIVSEEEWQELFEDQLAFVWNENSYWAESKELALLERRVDMLDKVKQYEDYFSPEYINKRILRRTDEEVDQSEKEIEEYRKKKAELKLVNNNDNDENQNFDENGDMNNG